MEITLENAPLKTIAPAVTGGFWERTERGWKWCTGDTFGRPGGDWNGKLILTCPMCNKKLPDGELVCCGIWHKLRA